MASTTLTVSRISGQIGAAVTGIDLRELSEERVDDIHGLLADNGVVVFREQHLTPDQHVAFARQLGEIRMPPPYMPTLAEAKHPEISVLSADNGYGRLADQWHADVTYAAEPPKYSILNMRHVPSAGGQTTWASQIVAYDALSDRMKAYLQGLTAVHAIRLIAGEVSHPVVIRHPRTGRPALFVNKTFTSAINELPPAESEAILAFLFNHQIKLEFTCRWQWSVGDLAVWDNHFVQHYALNDYPDYREINRIEIRGDAPIPFAA